MVTLRGRLLLAFALVALPPLALLAGAVTLLITRSFTQSNEQRLFAAVDAIRERLEALRQRAASQVAAAAREDLPVLADLDAEIGLAAAVGARRDLPAFEIVDSAGRLISSRHWPAGLNLEDRDSLFSGDPDFRIEKLSDGYGMVERVALMPSSVVRWRGAMVTVRGGFLLDAAFIEDLSRLMGLEVGLRDTQRGQWTLAADSPLQAWHAPVFDGGRRAGEASLASGVYLWAAGPCKPGVPLQIVVATPRTPLDRLTTRILGMTAAVAVVALLAVLGTALLLSARIARPVRELADGARRVSEGDFDTQVTASTSDEIGKLANAFNAMTAEIRGSRERLVQAERVAAWREMARRLAHELKNPLFPIQVSIETLGRAAREGRDTRSLVAESSQTLLQELRSLRRIVDEFSEFARLPRPVLTSVDVNSLLRQVLELERTRAAAIAVEMDLAPDLPQVRADRDLLSRALSNLVKNAFEAMPGEGHLRVATRYSGGSVRIEVADSGPGLPTEDRERLFTPYFTTKPSGTGLGLVVAQGIVADHGGRIEVMSEPGVGTTFSIVVPAAAPGPLPPTSSASQEEPPP